MPVPSLQVAELKAAVEASQGEAFPTARQILVYKGKILANETTLADAGVSEAGFLVVTVTMAKAPAKPAVPAEPAKPVQPAAAEAAPAAKETPPAPTPSPAPEGAPAARAEVAAPGPPSGTPAAGDAGGLFQGAASNLATGSALETAVANFIDMGFPEDKARKAMRAAFNNPDRAAEYLMNDSIPEQEEPVARAGAGTGAGTGAGAGSSPVAGVGAGSGAGLGAGPGAGAGAGAGSGADLAGGGQPNSRPLDLFGGAGQGGADGAEDPGAGALGFLRHNPQFQQLRQMVQANPQILQPMLQELGKQNPQLMQIISENQSEFLRLVSDAGEPGAEAAGAPPGVEGFPPTQIQISQGDKEAIDRLEGLGFDRLLCIEAFFACDKNESLAANYLLEHGHEDMSA